MRFHNMLVSDGFLYFFQPFFHHIQITFMVCDREYLFEHIAVLLRRTLFPEQRKTLQKRNCRPH